MISYEEALEALLRLAEPLGAETVELTEAAGRILAEPVVARWDQPPFAASSMDGYAMRASDAVDGRSLRVVGESAAGRRFAGEVPVGACVRIFTGAPVPHDCDHVVIQEDVERSGNNITLRDPEPDAHIRPAAWDFARGDSLQPGELTPARIALAAAMGASALRVVRRPRIAIVPTGDELVIAGETPGSDAIVSSNGYGIAAMLSEAGAIPQLLPPVSDDSDALVSAFDMTKGADLVLTIGGASVGDHDLVGEVAGGLGLKRSFYKVAMRPGKPLMAGRLLGSSFVGLPGNPVSAMVCARVFVLPMLRRMMGLDLEAPRRFPLGSAVEANGPRRHFMRGSIEADVVRPFERQDSALLGALASANALIVRPPQDAPREVGTIVDVWPL